jgi:hypothetical protein
MRRYSAGRSLIVLALAAALVPISAWGEEATCSSEQARSRFDEGLRQLEAGNWQDACLAFDASLTCRSRASTQVNVAACREHENKLYEALLGYQRALLLERNPSTAHSLEEKIRAQIRRLEERVPRLVLLCEVPLERLTVAVDDRELSAAELRAPLLVDPGKHRLLVGAPGYRQEKIDVVVDAGETYRLELKLTVAGDAEPDKVDALPASATPPSAPAANLSSTARTNAGNIPAAVKDAGKAPRSGNDGERTLGIVMGGAGLVTLGLAAGFAFHTRALVDEAERYCYGDGTCHQTGLDKLEQARGAQTGALVAGGIGLLTLGAGIGLVAAYPAPPKPPTVSQSQPKPPLSHFVVTPTLSGIVARGAF